MSIKYFLIEIKSMMVPPTQTVGVKLLFLGPMVVKHRALRRIAGTLRTET